MDDLQLKRFYVVLALLGTFAFATSWAASGLLDRPRLAVHRRRSHPCVRRRTHRLRPSNGASALRNVVPLKPEIWPALADLFASGVMRSGVGASSGGSPDRTGATRPPTTTARDLRALVDRRSDLAPGSRRRSVTMAWLVGWVGLGPRDAFRAAGQDRERRPSCRATMSGPSTASSWRRGRAAAAWRARSSEAAIDYARDHGAGTLEGYPVQTGEPPHLVGVGVHGHGGDVRARRVHRVRAIDLESRLPDATRGDAPHSLIAGTAGQQPRRARYHRPARHAGRPPAREDR